MTSVSPELICSAGGSDARLQRSSSAVRSIALENLKSMSRMSRREGPSFCHIWERRQFPCSPTIENRAVRLGAGRVQFGASAWWLEALPAVAASKHAILRSKTLRHRSLHHVPASSAATVWQP